MNRLMQALVLAGVVLCAVPAVAGKLRMVDGAVYSGVVEKVGPTGIIFLWQRQKDQPAPIKAGDDDLLFAAQGHASEARAVPFEQIDAMDGVPMQRFKALFGYNLFYRTMASLEASRIRVASTGDFVHQIVAAVSLILILALLVPLCLMLVSAVLPGERLSFSGAFVFTVVLTAVGMGFALASSELTRLTDFLGTGGPQMGLTLILVLAIGGIMHLSTRYGFLQGVVFTVVAGLGLVLARFAVDTVAQALVKSV